MCGISTFCEHTTVAVDSVVKVPPQTDLETACLLGCAAVTGWGSAVHSGEIQPGDTVIVMGVGGIGANAVQGALHAGATQIIAVDPVAFKRETARSLGATHVAGTIGEAAELARASTNGQGADVAIVTVGVIHGQHIAEAFSSVRKQGTVVVTGMGNIAEVGIPISSGELTLYQKTLKGSLFGSSNPTADIPRLLNLYESGHLKLRELITTRYDLKDISLGYRDMHAGKNIRGIVVF